MAFIPRDNERSPRVHVWPRDKSGRAIEQDLVDSGERIWPRIDAYAWRHQQDPARAANLLEATLVALSRARKSNGRLMRPIRNLDNYLYLAFIRRLNRQLAKEPKLKPSARATIWTPLERCEADLSRRRLRRNFSSKR